MATTFLVLSLDVGTNISLIDFVTASSGFLGGARLWTWHKHPRQRVVHPSNPGSGPHSLESSVQCRWEGRSAIESERTVGLTHNLGGAPATVSPCRRTTCWLQLRGVPGDCVSSVSIGGSVPGLGDAVRWIATERER
jgi:hypothetical protein